VTQFTLRSGEGGWGAARADPSARPVAERWAIGRAVGDPADLHGLAVRAGRSLRWCWPDRVAVVLGSTQPLAHLDLARTAAAGLSVVRRRSGGGAVLVGPRQLLWADVTIPAGDPLWDDDVGRAAWWVGEAWAQALAGLGVDELAVHRGALRRSDWSHRLCFAGLGAGEVTAAGRKVVGLSQRRTRSAALFQCAALLRWNPDVLTAVLADAPPAGEVPALAVGLVDLLPGVAIAAVEAAFEEALPA
jgi:lipoate-protein ligase A